MGWAVVLDLHARIVLARIRAASARTSLEDTVDYLAMIYETAKDSRIRTAALEAASELPAAAALLFLQRNNMHPRGAGALMEVVQAEMRKAKALEELLASADLKPE